jgi:hypothetical protein
MARRLAVVSVQPAGHSSAAFDWDHYPARSAGELSRSSTSPLPRGVLSGELCSRLLSGWAAWRGNRVARLRVASHATALWATMGYPAPRGLVGLLAFGGLSDAGSWWLPHKLPHFLSAGYGACNHLHVGVQPHSWKHFHCYLVACQRRYSRGCFGTTLSSRGPDQLDFGRRHRLWGASTADSHPDPRSAWLTRNWQNWKRVESRWRCMLSSSFRAEGLVYRRRLEREGQRFVCVRTSLSHKRGLETFHPFTHKIAPADGSSLDGRSPMRLHSADSRPLGQLGPLDCQESCTRVVMHLYR